MKNFLESIKDFIYDSIDYIIMFSIIGIVVMVIGWRLNILFDDQSSDKPVASGDKVETTLDNEDTVEDNTDNAEPENNTEEKDTTEEKDNADDIDNSDEETDIPPTSPDIAENGEIIKVVIPAGSLPSKIGDILESNGLVSSKKDFVLKSQEMNLDTKLKSGNYDIEVGTSIESIVEIIAK